MKITKFGHSCILLDDGQTKLLIDPGAWSQLPELSVDGVIITHAHQDHFTLEKLQALEWQSEPKIITNSEVKTELEKNSLTCDIVEAGQETIIGSIRIQAFGNQHAIIHPDLPTFQNTGYLINEKFFHPGDALEVPTMPVEFLFLPVSAPWSKIQETLDYITILKPKYVFPIHDAILSPEAASGVFYRLAASWCEKIEAEFITPELGKVYEFSI